LGGAALSVQAGTALADEDVGEPPEEKSDVEQKLQDKLENAVVKLTLEQAGLPADEASAYTRTLLS
jgi:hypothetical protein